jgi:hypothetical protein
MSATALLIVCTRPTPGSFYIYPDAVLYSFRYVLWYEPTYPRTHFLIVFNIHSQNVRGDRCVQMQMTMLGYVESLAKRK